MSPRAAWRLEALSYGEVYDYVTGKSDWIAAGLPTEGRVSHPQRVIDALDANPPTCSLSEPASAARNRMDRGDAEVCVVVNEAGVVQGRLRHPRLKRATRARPRRSWSPVRPPSAPTLIWTKPPNACDAAE